MSCHALDSVPANMANPFAIWLIVSGTCRYVLHCRLKYFLPFTCTLTKFIMRIATSYAAIILTFSFKSSFDKSIVTCHLFFVNFSGGKKFPKQTTTDYIGFFFFMYLSWCLSYLMPMSGFFYFIFGIGSKILLVHPSYILFWLHTPDCFQLCQPRGLFTLQLMFITLYDANFLLVFLSTSL